MSRLIVLLAAVLVVACSSSSSSGSASVTGASVDPSYFCPGGSDNAPYALHATVRFHNGTSKAVTIDSVTAQMTVASIKGSWLEKVGETYNADGVTVAPASVPAAKDASLTVTIPSACTSGRYGNGVSSSAEYDVKLHLVTSAGSFNITTANQHEIVAD